jgi:predicted GH43/DUF377 family glycosyl hydrolase
MLRKKMLKPQIKLRGIVKRHPANPIVKPTDMPLDCSSVYNGGAIKLGDGRYVLLLRTEDASRKQWVYAARGTDGVSFSIDPEPVEFVATDMDKYEKYAANSFYDPRINLVENHYIISYAAYTFRYGCRIGLGETDDFKIVKHISFPHHVQNRNAVLFPRRINNHYMMLHRPEHAGNGHLWISRSPDLHFWGDTEVVQDRGGGHWDSIKIGAGTPPIETSQGWLVLTHAVCGSCAGHFYSMGAILLDLENPYKVIGYSKAMLLAPEELYETNGFVPNVVFPTGAILEPDGMLKIYYGASDNFECLAEAKLDELVEACLQ